MNDTISLAALDVVIIAVYLVVVLYIGARLAKRTKTGEDLFLAGRRLTWWAIGFSLFASNISSTTLIGLSGAAYEGGLFVSNYEWMATVVLVFFVLFIAPVFIKNRIATAPEFLEKRFDRRSRVYFSGLTIFTNIVVDTAGSLFAGALVLMLFFPGLDLYTTCIALALVAGVYTAAGGLLAVVYTDVLQAIVLLIGSVVLGVLMFGEIDFSWARLQAETPPEMLSVIRPLDDPNLPWLGTLIGVPVLGFYFWCTNQFIVQRVLGARDLNQARWGSLLGGLLKLPVLFIMVLPGVMARLVFPDLEVGDAVFPTMVSHLLPAGLTGLVLAGLLAAIMSSIDSTLNSASTLVTLDFVKPWRPGLSPEREAWIGRIAVGVFMVLAALWAPQIANFAGLFHYLQQALSYIVPPVAALFILGVLWWRGTARAAFFTLLGGHAVSIAVFVLQQVEVLPSLHFTIVAGILFGLSCGLFVLISLLDEAPDRAEVRALTERDQGPRPKSWWKDYRVHSAVLLALTAALVIAFW